MPSKEVIISWLKIPKKAWVDALVLGTLLVSINLFFAWKDPGWLEVNPNPYLLIPILLGGRYGSTVAFYSALFTAILVFSLHQISPTATGLRLFLSEKTYLVFSWFIFGILSGEVNEYFRRKADKFGFLYEESKDKLRKLDNDIKKIAQINNKLQRQVLTSDNQTFSLDIEIRGLYECPPEDLWIKTLLVLNRMERITNAAIYSLPDSNGHLKRHAVLGKDKTLPKQLKIEEHRILQLAIENKQIAALPEILGESSSEKEPFIFIMPLLDAEEKPFALVVVAEMPFMSFTPRNLKRIELIASWAAEILDLRLNESDKHYRVLSGPENKRIFMPSYFKTRLKLSIETFRQHDIPSTLILVYPEDSGKITQAALEQIIIKRVRTGDFAAQIDSNKPHVGVLLPFTAERGGTIFVESCQGMIKGRSADFPTLKFDVFQIKDFETSDALWKELHKKLSA